MCWPHRTSGPLWDNTVIVSQFIHPGLHLNPELSTHPVIRELDTPWMTNPERRSLVLLQHKEWITFWNNYIIIVLSVWCLLYVFFATRDFSGTMNSTETRGSTKREPVAVIGTDYFRVDLQRLQALSKPQINLTPLSRHIHIYSEVCQMNEIGNMWFNRNWRNNATGNLCFTQNQES